MHIGPFTKNFVIILNQHFHFPSKKRHLIHLGVFIFEDQFQGLWNARCRIDLPAGLNHITPDHINAIPFFMKFIHTYLIPDP